MVSDSPWARHVLSVGPTAVAAHYPLGDYLILVAFHTNHPLCLQEEACPTIVEPPPIPDLANARLRVILCCVAVDPSAVGARICLDVPIAEDLESSIAAGCMHNVWDLAVGVTPPHRLGRGGVCGA